MPDNKNRLVGLWHNARQRHRAGDVLVEGQRDPDEVEDHAEPVIQGANLLIQGANLRLTPVFDDYIRTTEMAMAAAEEATVYNGAGDVVFTAGGAGDAMLQYDNGGARTFTMPTGAVINGWSTPPYTPEPAEGTVEYQHLLNARAQIKDLRERLARDLDIPLELLR